MPQQTDHSFDPVEVEVAIPSKVSGTFTYQAPHPIAPGTRVQVPFGMQKLIGVVVEPRSPPTNGSQREFKLRSIGAVLDQQPLFSAELLTLAQWLAHYYIHPIGEVLRTMLPLGTQKKTKEVVTLTPKGYRKVHEASPEARLLRDLFKDPCIDSVESIGDGPWPQTTLATFRQRLFKHLKSQEAHREAWCWKLASPPVQPGTAATKLLIQGLTRRSLVKLEKSTNFGVRESLTTGSEDPGLKQTPPIPLDLKPELTSSQRQVFERVRQHGWQQNGPEVRGKHQVFLLHGVTGSGKTEIYLNLIESLITNPSFVPAAPQVLVLVPEISLTPQMTGVFSRRFPDQIAVVHSAMADQKRWQELQRIREGRARVLIGPRSAVFGPFQNLALIIVDEEHDSSYKQDTGLHYNGRDVAVVRGKIHDIPVLLGSATPSLESYHNALEGRYQLLELPERVGTSRLPRVTVLPVTSGGQSFQSSPLKLDQSKPHGVTYQDSDLSHDIAVDPQVLSALRETLERGEQGIVLVNRRGFATYLKSLTTGKPVQCPQCSIAMALHRKTQILRCHYCSETLSVAELLKGDGADSYGAVGYGSQKAEDFLKQILPHGRIARLDSDTMTGDSLTHTLQLFRERQLDILVGTQILAKGHDFPKVTLVALLEVDMLLNLPDFRAGERTFQLIVQAAGRAGRGELPGKVILQAQQHEHPIVVAATEQNYQAFLRFELAQRRALFYPPFSRMVSFCFTCSERTKLETSMAKVAKLLSGMAEQTPDRFINLRVLGPSVPAIERLRDAYRYMLILVGPTADIKNLKNLAAILSAAFQKLPHGVAFTVDVDPQNLM